MIGILTAGVDQLPLYDETSKEAIIARSKPASDEMVEKVLNASTEGSDGRSRWMWFRLANGDLILGVFPQGDTYLGTESESNF
jgi:hypothetical protein